MIGTAPKPSIGWMGAVALGFGGVNLTLYNLSPLISQYGSCIVLLFILALIVTLISSLGFLELVLMYPNKSGGIAVACTEAFRVYSPILSNIVGVSYWLAWLMAASFGSFYLASIIQYLVPWVSVKYLSISLILCVTILNLFGLSWASCWAIPLAFLASFLVLLSVLIPVFSGQVVLGHLKTYSFISANVTDFGKLSTVIASFYFIGWIVPGYESVLCYVGETQNPKKSVPRTFYLSIGLAVLFYGICPLIWLSVLGPKALTKDLSQVLAPVFSPLLGGYAQIGVVWLMIFNMLVCLFAPLAGPPRTIAQLAQDGLLPELLGKTSRLNVPWVALLLTSFISIGIVCLGAPRWLIAASNFQYLLCIGLASVAVWILRKRQPHAPRLYRAPTIVIYLGLLSAGVWFVATVLGFSQYGLDTMLVGLSFTFVGIPFYLWRKARDRIKQGLPVFSRSLHFKLTGIVFGILVFNTIGYLVAVHSIQPEHSEFIRILEDIFLLVALLSITIGLIVPGMIVSAAEEINNATKRIVDINLHELSEAMEALGAGKMGEVHIQSEVIPIAVATQDELGEMALNFNKMQDEIRKTALSTTDVHKRLLSTMSELTALNKSLEERVIDRTRKFENEKRKAEEATRVKSVFVSTVTHELRTPMTAIKGSLELILYRIENGQIESSDLLPLISLAHQNANRMIRLITDILNEEKIAAGKFTLNLKKQLLYPLIQQALASNSLFAQQYQVSLQLGDVLLDAQAEVDEDRFIQVLDNLLSNAAKFSRPDTQVLLSMQRINGFISIAIQDMGEGFSEDFAQKIFHPFMQDSKSGAQVGTGLGLSIAKSIIEQHHGSIHFKTSPTGSIFYINLPEAD